jgi:glycosyltransferase 2 family protein
MSEPLTSPVKHKTVRRIIRKSWRWLLGILGLVLVWQALSSVALNGVLKLLSGLGPLAVLIILGFNLLLLALMTARWWLLLRTLGAPVNLLTACAYRLAANAVSYLTPGPHFGGEPLSIYLLYHRQYIPLSTATTSVIVDRLLELSASLAVLALCLVGLALVKGGPFTRSWALFGVIAVLAVFSGFLSALFTGQRPASRSVLIVNRFCERYFPWISSRLGSLVEILTKGEVMAESLLKKHRRRFLLANLLSLFHWLGVFVEFWLMSALLGLPLSFWQLTAVVAAARLAFLTPLPAGIGVLETVLMWETAAFGQGSALGISLCLIIRFRDLIFSLAGLGLAMHYLTCPGKPSIIGDK